MPNIFSYTDYRVYLKDYYDEQKAAIPAFSYRYFANKAGFKSKSFIKLVIDGKKNLTSESIDKINNVLKIKEKAFSYFCDLVAFNQATSIHLRQFYFHKLMQYNKRSDTRTVLRRQYEIYSHWYINALRELVVIIDFGEDYAKLGSILNPPISAKQARDAVELLLELGFIKKKGSRYIQSDAIITTGDQVRSLAVSSFHLQNLRLAADSIEKMQSDSRDISTLVLGLSDEGFTLVKKEISKFRKKLLDIAAVEKTVNRVYHINFQAIPVSEEIHTDDN